MGKFNESEKQHIKAELRKRAYDLFLKKGLKNTSIEDITSSVDIAKSTFYAFFDSKEALYMALLEGEGEEIEQAVWPEVKALEDPCEAIKAYLNGMAQALEAHVLTQRMVYDLEEYKLVSRKLNPGYVGSENLRSIVPLMAFIRDLKDRNQIIDEEPQVIAGLLKAALLVSNQKSDLEQYSYERIKDLIFDAVAKEITRRV